MSSRNDVAWEKIFRKYNILQSVTSEGHIFISSTAINEFREARLMTKFDHASQLPALFSSNNLSILPVSRGGYIIGTFETFEKFNKDEVDLTSISFPQNLESLDYKSISSESTAINCAFVSGILQDFTGEQNLIPTVNGRMSSSSFEFVINDAKGNFTVGVANSQVEIDGGYEGENSLILIEAKNYISDDFLVRQMYYPFRLWSGKIAKNVRNIFLTYTNGVFHLREYGFQDEKHYNSIFLMQHKKYAVLEDGAFNVEYLQQLLEELKPIIEPPIPFPQANSFSRIVNLGELFKEHECLSKERITENYDFDSRQTDYYLNAGKYLGLFEIGRDEATGQLGGFLSVRGLEIFDTDLLDRQKEFTKLILSHRAFADSLKLYLESGAEPKKTAIVAIMKASGLYMVRSDATYFRRASTILGWLNWILGQLED
ncbi:hypothetical protein [Pedobacter sp. Leaf194]|uniref:type II restriction enzyme n=1 Tax=Pedobacter sp. Leaf194 TaxID=1736297 RepID=UPI00070292FC|nr:hypothetical protein [Pedobacter sp. Leaf194]KQS36823.1 hypothetical protein ASG14_07235 [Pedobacter sp. Leaf194]